MFIIIVSPHGARDDYMSIVGGYLGNSTALGE